MTTQGKKPDQKELAERLRANLRRRKQQLRARQTKDEAAGADDASGEGG